MEFAYKLISSPGRTRSTGPLDIDGSKFIPENRVKSNFTGPSGNLRALGPKRPMDKSALPLKDMTDLKVSYTRNYPFSKKG
ncbi:hypothetical protein TNCV_100851 [Trichonephila clavipes]|nr:hypothetical protein TNCV_100851 [Trichonephila clavipes]